MSLSLLICLLSFTVWLICYLSDKYSALMELAKFIVAVSLLAFLLGK